MQSVPLLQDRVVIVTGGSHGIGRAFAIGCASQGAKVVMADLREATETVTAVEQVGAQALYVRTDVTDEGATQRMAAEAVRTFGRIDGLINNAAYFREVALVEFENISVELWDTIFAVNVRGPFLCCKAVMSTLRAQGSGSIVNISSATAVGGGLPASSIMSAPKERCWGLPKRWRRRSATTVYGSTRLPLDSSSRTRPRAVPRHGGSISVRRGH